MSADQLAIIYNAAFEEELTSQSGDMEKTLQTALRVSHLDESGDDLLKFGYCPNSLELKAMTVGPRTPLSEKIKHLRDLKTNYDLPKSNPENSAFKTQYDLYVSEGSILAEIPYKRFTEALDKSNTSNFLLHFADILCGDYRAYNDKQDVTIVTHAKKKEFTHIYKTGPSCTEDVDFNLVDDVHRLLNANKIVGVAYYSALIQRGGNLDLDSIGHAGVVVGREWRNGSCQFRLRNSWGAECQEPDGNGKMVSRYSQYVQGCEGGNLWIKENDLERAMDTITFIVHGADPIPQLSPPPGSPSSQCRLNR